VPDVDLFATHANAKLSRFVTWAPDKRPWRTDAFSFSWSNIKGDTSHCPSMAQESPAPPTPHRPSPSLEEAKVNSLEFIRAGLRDRGFSETATAIILQSWRQSTPKQYSTYIRQ